MTDSRIQKVNSLLKDIRIDYDSLSKPVDSLVSSIREAIDAIPEGFKVDSRFLNLGFSKNLSFINN